MKKIVSVIMAILVAVAISGCGGGSGSGSTSSGTSSSVPIVSTPTGPQPASVNIVQADVSPQPVSVGSTFNNHWKVDFVSATDFYTMTYYLSNTPNIDSKAVKLFTRSGGAAGGVVSAHEDTFPVTRTAQNTYDAGIYGVTTVTTIDYTQPVVAIFQACINEKTTMYNEPMCVTNYQIVKFN